MGEGRQGGRPRDDLFVMACFFTSKLTLNLIWITTSQYSNVIMQAVEVSDIYL